MTEPKDGESISFLNPYQGQAIENDEERCWTEGYRLAESELLPKLNEAEARIAELEKEVERLRNPWVSVEERLPTQRAIFVSHKFGVGEADYIANRFVLPSNWNTQVPNVTHWMPLPKPPKSDEAQHG